MGFMNVLKGKGKGKSDEHQSQPPSQPPPYQSPEINFNDNPKKSENFRMFGLSVVPAADSKSNYAPPPGPPPSKESYTPPPGPPPSSDNANPPPYHDWLSVPDNSLLPPPPALHDDYSPSNNASFHAAEAGHLWCDRNRVYQPAIPNPALLEAIKTNGVIHLEMPQGFRGSLEHSSPSFHDTEQIYTSACVVTSPSYQDDTTIVSNLPLYFATRDNPLLVAPENSRPFSISYSIRVLRIRSEDAGIAIGFASKPYPPFRLPGWHRGSLAIHSDDGRRYVNDSWGGKPFTAPFSEGDEITLSMTLSPTPSPMQRSTSSYAMQVSSLPKCRTRVEMSRNGVVEGGWDLHEERDAEKDEGVEGLQGDGDLYAAIGVCGDVAVEVRFWPQDGIKHV